MSDQNKEILRVAVQSLDGKKGKDLQVLQIDNITVMTDYFVICTGTSATHVKALADEVEYQITEQLAVEPIHKDINDGGKWLLLDYAGVMIHVFCEQSRDFYKLERLWNGAEVIKSEDYEVEE